MRYASDGFGQGFSLTFSLFSGDTEHFRPGVDKDGPTGALPESYQPTCSPIKKKGFKRSFSPI
jgi:hypothetical protein